MKRSTTWIAVAAVVLLAVLAWIATADGLWTGTPAGNPTGAPTSTGNADGADAIHRLFEGSMSNVEVHGTGTVSRILADDDEGSPHQKFILTMSDGLTLLFAHNIDIAPRLDGLTVGDTVEFLGEYEWGEQGGTVHWTHRDPQGAHQDGWLKWEGRVYA